MGFDIGEAFPDSSGYVVPEPMPHEGEPRVGVDGTVWFPDRQERPPPPMVSALPALTSSVWIATTGRVCVGAPPVPSTRAATSSSVNRACAFRGGRAWRWLKGEES
jgi:hypothetical protein